MDAPETSCLKLTGHVVGEYTPVLEAGGRELHEYRVFLGTPLPLHETRPKHLEMPG